MENKEMNEENSLRYKMMKGIFINTGGREDSPEIAFICAKIAKEFAQHHVKLALEAAAGTAQVKISGNNLQVDRNSIINAYPLENIK